MTVHIDRTLRLSESEFFPEAQRKTGIAIHHTVCGAARTTVELWQKNKERVATAYVVDHDGTVFEVFDPSAWAYQFGLTWPDAARIPFEQRFIGIEIASEGGLVEQHGELYAFDQISPGTIRPRSGAFDYGRDYRGYRWFDQYEPAQIEAVGHLVADLCARFSIPPQYPDPPFDYCGDALQDFEGVIGHAMVRLDKSDPAPDPRLWKALRDIAGLKPCAAPPLTKVALLTRREIDDLFQDNAQHINVMDTAAGSLVKALTMELERRRVYLRFSAPRMQAHTIRYTMAQGDPKVVGRLARALGFRRVSSRTLEVRHG